MFLRNFLLLILTGIAAIASAQDNWAVSLIPAALKENANAVVRLQKTEVDISARKSMNVKRMRVITILNENGYGHIDASENFDNSTTIKAIDAVVYDAAGVQIKKFKKKDFREQSVSEGSIVSDNKVIYLNYTPLSYPFTIVYTSETQHATTAFIPSWYAVEDLFVSVEKTEIKFTYTKDLGFKYKEYNFSGADIQKEATDITLSYKAKDIPALKREDYSPSYSKILPHVIFGLTKFNLEGVEGEAVNWESFGAWMYNNLLAGTDELLPETQAKIKSLTANETDPLKKAKIVYEYVQAKTRYISIQLGIGGWKPMLAKDVDRLGYGDCKALTNYTRALLKAAGVDSYYTVVYGDRDKRDLREDFVSMQGNHVILAIPVNNQLKWLECTSQTAPFGFQGNFTDDRMVLLVKPEGGMLVRTHVYEAKGNTQLAKGSYTISDNGSISGNVLFASKGTQYEEKYSLDRKSAEDVDKYYKQRFDNINSLALKKKILTNNKDTQEFIEDITIEAPGYCSKNGNSLIFSVNAFNPIVTVPHRYRTRKNPFVVSRGYVDTDEVVINLPEGYVVDAKPENITFTDKYGEYTAEYTMDGSNKLIYKRTLLINSGNYKNDEYESYRQFREKVARNEGAKIVLIKK